MLVKRKVLPFYSFTGKRYVLWSALSNSMHEPFNFFRLVLLARSVVTPWRLIKCRASEQWKSLLFDTLMCAMKLTVARTTIIRRIRAFDSFIV